MLFLHHFQVSLVESVLDRDLQLWQSDVEWRPLILSFMRELSHIEVVLAILYQLVEVLLHERLNGRLVEKQVLVVSTEVF